MRVHRVCSCGGYWGRKEVSSSPFPPPCGRRESRSLLKSGSPESGKFISPNWAPENGGRAILPSYILLFFLWLLLHFVFKASRWDRRCCYIVHAKPAFLALFSGIHGGGHRGIGRMKFPWLLSPGCAAPIRSVGIRILRNLAIRWSAVVRGAECDRQSNHFPNQFSMEKRAASGQTWRKGAT